MLVDMSGQWKLNQNPVNSVVVIKLPQFSDQLLRCDRGWNRQLTAVDPELLTCFGFHVDVRRRCRVISHQDDCKSRANPTLSEVFNVSSNLAFDIFRNLCSVYKSRGHTIGSGLTEFFGTSKQGLH